MDNRYQHRQFASRMLLKHGFPQIKTLFLFHEIEAAIAPKK
jgi:hypothetical protein